MGSCIASDLENRRLFGNSLLESQATKYFSESSTLQFDIHTWSNRNLPNLRNLEDMTTQSVNTSQQGRIFYNSRANSILFQKNEIGHSAPLPDCYQYNSHPTSVFELKVSKIRKGFKIDFSNEPGYELLTTEKQVCLGQKFFIGGLEYEVINFVTNPQQLFNKLTDTSRTFKQIDLNSNPKITRNNHSLSKKQKSESEKLTCRICLDDQVSKENPLISPCDCTGSVKFCHLQCWKSWIMSSEISKDHCYVGNLLKQQCEICKKNLLMNSNFRDTVTSLLSSNANIKPPFVVLEAVQPVSNSVYYKKNTAKLGFIFISFAGKTEVSLGNSTEADVPLTNQLGNTKKNACLKIKDGKLYLRDEASKYGTFIKREGPITIKDNISRHFLYKNNIISLKVE